MTVTRAWIAGRFVDDVGSFSPSRHGSNGDHQPQTNPKPYKNKTLNPNPGTDLAAMLDPRVVSQLNAAIAVNCSACLRKQEGTGGLPLFP